MSTARVAAFAVFALTFSLSLPAVRAATTASEHGSPKGGLEFFEQKIRPLLVRRCYECHSGDPAKAKGNFVLDTREGLRKGGQSGAAIVPGHPEESLLVEAIRYEGLEMPPNERLPDEAVDDLVRWIEMGAPDPRSKAAKNRGKLNIAEARKWWSFQLPKPSQPPEVEAVSWPRSNIDRFILARLEKAGLKPVADADRLTLIRRATFDLTGLPPTPEEIDAFLHDTSDGALATVVDRLLESPRFGERWGRLWLDVARYAESSGKERNIPYKYAWQYRDWVIDSFNADKPYNEFLLEQLAGDLLPAKSAEERNTNLIATGFLALGPKSLNTNNPEQLRMDVVDDQIDVTMRGVLGLTVACARCHDHKFDPIPQTDYYALAGIFHSTLTLAGVKTGRGPDGPQASDAMLLALADPNQSNAAMAADMRRRQARQAEAQRMQTQLAALRAEVRKYVGMPGNLKGGFKGGKGKNAQVPPHVKQLRREIKELEQRLADLDAQNPPAPDDAAGLAMGVCDDGAPANCHLLNRGELKDQGPEVPRGTLTVFKTGQVARMNPAHSGRLELARWVAGRDNPLTARVMVNRVWQALFGSGLVDTPDNFGALGEEPSHPELLDTLAVGFMNDNWSVKRLIRAIVLSRTYQLSSRHNAENFAVDSANRLLWRMNRRRLDAEEIRDAMLAASGQLELERPQGSPVAKLGTSDVGRDEHRGELRKPMRCRSVYLPMVRGMVPQELAVFDMADPSLITAKRDVTNVATQALFMLNNPFVMQQSVQMARRLTSQKDLNEPSRIELAYRLTLGRLPTDKEKARILAYLKDYRQMVSKEAQGPGGPMPAWPSVCQTLFASAEFRFLY